jgi:hypothetical protein
VCSALFATSTLFPILAGFLREDQKPRWLGRLDVVIAAATAVSAMMIAARNRSVVTDDDRVAALRHAQLVSGIIPVLLVLFFVAGDRVNWQVMVIGLAWRGWFLIAILPYLEAARSRAESAP